MQLRKDRFTYKKTFSLLSFTLILAAYSLVSANAAISADEQLKLEAIADAQEEVANLHEQLKLEAIADAQEEVANLHEHQLY